MRGWEAADSHPLFNGAPGNWNWQEISAAFRKERAVELIKRQPFYLPRVKHPYDCEQWSPEQIVAYLDEHKPLVFNMIGVDLAKPDSDRTAVWAERHGMLDAKSRYARAMVDMLAMVPPVPPPVWPSEAMLKAVATHGSAYSKVWLEPGSPGVLAVATIAYDDVVLGDIAIKPGSARS